METELSQKDLNLINNRIESQQYTIQKALLKQAIEWWCYVREKNLSNSRHTLQDIALENYLDSLVTISGLSESVSELRELINPNDGGG